MSHFEYYQFQAKARGVASVEDVERIADQKAYLYDRIVLPWLPLDKESAVAELACGHGSLLHWLKRKGFTDVTGVDSSAEQTHLAQQVNKKIAKADVNIWLREQLPNSHRVLLALDLVEHLSKDDFLELLKLANRTLISGGILILRLPSGDSPLVGRNLFNDITHVWTYTPNCLQSLAMMTGFSSADFIDESSAAIRDHRWIKVPLSRFVTALLRLVVWTSTRERVNYWSPHLWVKLQK
jgi:cyclopropane fatty-acyl-phospholipid synthase-like methyltransferase